ncbi:MAG: YigZ family protein [Bacteroidetes bacterium HGW-Bacteroidetes-21]|jgi:uncharacterized YigZ family protein|nr:MAG: YigZ family protein [Bacteroidetes bacterium HGW-Bacteroidetes-21]
MAEGSDKYLTIAGKTSGSFYDRKSRFIAIAYPLNDESQIKKFLKELRKEYYDAVHHCYAWELTGDTVQHRANDDGEPSGSAGLSIYNLIKSRNLTNILIVVIRYYGGIKLGVPGLINAYRQASAEALENAEVIEKFLMKRFTIQFPYLLSNDVMQIAKKYELNRVDERYNDEGSVMTFEIRASQLDACCEALNGLQGLVFNETKTEENGLA